MVAASCGPRSTGLFMTCKAIWWGFIQVTTRCSSISPVPTVHAWLLNRMIVQAVVSKSANRASPEKTAEKSVEIASSLLMATLKTQARLCRVCYATRLFSASMSVVRCTYLSIGWRSILRNVVSATLNARNQSVVASSARQVKSSMTRRPILCWQWSNVKCARPAITKRIACSIRVLAMWLPYLNK